MLRVRVSELARNISGVAATEFALVVPVVMALTMGVIEVGYIVFAKINLEGAVQEAARRGVTGFAPDGVSREEYVRNRITDAMDRFSLEGPIVINTRVYENFGDIGEPEPFSDDNGNGTYDPGECFSDVNGNAQYDTDMAQAGLGGSGAVVVYSTSVRLGMLSPVFSWMTENNTGAMTLEASTAVRNEPFDLTAGGAQGGVSEIC